MVTMLVIIHVLVCIFLTLVVLLQQGNKQGMGAAFGGGGSTSVFGGRGANTFLQKLTAGAAGLFMVTSLALSYLSSPRGVMEDEGADQTKKVESPADKKADAPAAPAAPTPAEGAAAPAPAPAEGAAAPAAPAPTPAAPAPAPAAGGDKPAEPAPAPK